MSVKVSRRNFLKAGAAVAFALYPTSVSQLMAIADAGEVMPPKSTWFEPKLLDGLVSQASSAPSICPSPVASNSSHNASSSAPSQSLSRLSQTSVSPGLAFASPSSQSPQVRPVASQFGSLVQSAKPSLSLSATRCA